MARSEQDITRQSCGARAKLDIVCVLMVACLLLFLLLTLQATGSVQTLDSNQAVNTYSHLADYRMIAMLSRSLMSNLSHLTVFRV